MKQLTLEERITVLMSLAVYQVRNLLLITKLNNNATDLMYKIQKKHFFWEGKNTKIKRNTL